MENTVAVSPKKCIWCYTDEIQTTFGNKAHTIPESMGGQMICINVCDGCNSYFGSIHDKLPAIEETLKEAFNITRTRFLGEKNYGPNKALARFKSRYFNVNLKERKMSLKPAFQLKPSFLYTLARQFKRGIYKIYLEEIERQNNDGFNAKHNLIRDFARYNIGELPVFYFEKTYGMLLTHPDWIKNPILHIHKNSRMKYLHCNDHFFEFELLGHVFGIAISTEWQENLDEYLYESTMLKKKLFFQVKQIKFLTDMDLTLNKYNS